MLMHEDILRQILYRLPLSDVNECKLLNKECYSLISGPDFLADRRRFLGDHAVVSIYGPDTQRLEVSCVRSRAERQPFFDTVDLPSYVAKYYSRQPVILGSFNGLIAVQYSYAIICCGTK